MHFSFNQIKAVVGVGPSVPRTIDLALPRMQAALTKLDDFQKVAAHNEGFPIYQDLTRARSSVLAATSKADGELGRLAAAIRGTSTPGAPPTPALQHALDGQVHLRLAVANLAESITPHVSPAGGVHGQVRPALVGEASLHFTRAVRETQAAVRDFVNASV